MLKERKLTYRIGAKGQHQSAIVRTVYEVENNGSVEDVVEDMTALFQKKVGNGSAEATLTRLAVFFRGLLESQGWPEGRSMTSADIDAFAGDHLGKRRAVDALQGCEKAIELIQKNDSKSALSWATMAFISGIFATFGYYEELIRAGRSKTSEGAAAKKAKSDRLKETIRPEWERLRQTGKSAKRAGELIAKMKDETGEPLAKGRSADTIRRWFEK